MIRVHVFISVKEEYVLPFKEATIENARNSFEEPGVIRFEFLQPEDQPCEFVLEEIYISGDDQAKHRETQHYKKWKETTAAMIARAYTITYYNSIWPERIMK